MLIASQIKIYNNKKSVYMHHHPLKSFVLNGFAILNMN